MTMTKLIGLSLEAPIRRFKLWLIDGELKAYYAARDNVTKTIKHGFAAQREIDMHIVDLESRRNRI